MNTFSKKIEELQENILAEIKGLLVDIMGQPNVAFETVKQVDDFIGDIEKILKTDTKYILKDFLSEILPEERGTEEQINSANFGLNHWNECRAKVKENGESLIEKI